MAKQSYRSKSYARHSTRRGSTPRDPRRIRLIVGGIVGAVAVIVAALVWGSILKAKSDAYRASLGENGWIVDTDIAEPLPVDAPEGNAISTQIDEWVDHDYDGAILYLGSSGEEETLPFASETLEVAGMPHGTWPLAREVDRLHGNGFTVTGVFTVTSFAEEDAAVAAYRKGLEMALLTEFAHAGFDDILLVGVPVGDEKTDAASVAYLREAKAVVAGVTDTLALGVALDTSAFYGVVDEQKVYSDHLSPARILSVCDYLAVDLRESGNDLENTLKDLQYPYVRYGLRLLLNGEDGVAEDTVTAHGFEQYMLYRPIA